MLSPTPLQYGQTYHIYNRGNNRGNVFFEERNYRYFLQLYAKYVEPVAYTFVYCLLRNHFHFLVRIKTLEEQQEYHKTLGVSDKVSARNSRVSTPFKPKNPSQQFGNLLNAYAKAINKAYQRTGSLFQHPFGRISVTSDAYFTQLVAYIHHNPGKHGLVDDLRLWPHSSYHTLLTNRPTRLMRNDVLAWFGSAQAFQAFHQQDLNEHQIAPLVGDDFD